MSHAIFAPAPIRSIRPPDPDVGIAPILIRIPAVDRRDQPHTPTGPRRRRLRREVRGVLWVLLGTVLGWAITTYRALPTTTPDPEPGPVVVRLSLEADSPTSPSPAFDEPVRPIALKGFLLPSEAH